MSNPIVEVKNLTFTYPNGFTALKNINFVVENNEFVAIIGQNGAGKSTLLKNLTGILKPTVGAVLIDGLNTKNISVSRLSSKLGFVLQNPDRQLFADTIYEEVAFGPRNLKLDKEEIESRVTHALEVTGLLEHKDKFPPSLSTGERAKVVIASVVAMKPDVIIFDEPTTGQDYKGCYQIMNIAREFYNIGHTVIFVTHHMALVAEYATRTIVFCKGEILLDDTTENVFAHPEILKKSYIVPPQITQIGQELKNELGTDKIFLNVNDLCDCILKRSKELIT